MTTTVKTKHYKGYNIDYWAKPGPCRAMDWGFAHKDFDGAPDSRDTRFGYAASLEEAMAAIDEQIESELPVMAKTYLHAENEDLGDTLVSLGFEKDTNEYETAFVNLSAALWEVEFIVNLETGEIAAVNGLVVSSRAYLRD